MFKHKRLVYSTINDLLSTCNCLFQFSSVLFSLLDRISQLGRDNYNEKVLNVLHRWRVEQKNWLLVFQITRAVFLRLDFNGFYTTAIDQFKADTG